MRAGEEVEAAVEPLQPGDPRRVGSYHLVARLGAGGMGVVYVGRSPAGRTVAVKLIHERFVSDVEYRARFRREVAAARKVAGAFTAAVLSADPDATPPWLATAYLPGPSLLTAIRTYGAMPPEAVRLLGAGLAEALVDIHRAGVVHRDLKPANVILTAGGPRVIDFGIARPEDATALTLVGTFLGTPGFMSPEQVRGGEIGPASDVFSLGVVLAYVATAEEPFGSGLPVERLRRTRGAAADLDGIEDQLLRDVVSACLRPEPADRPAAAEVLDRLGGGAGSLHGTGWLPPALASAVVRATDEARLLPRHLREPGAVPRDAPGAESAAIMGQPTDLSEQAGSPAPAARGGGPFGLSRRVLIGAGAGVAGLAAIGGLVAFWPGRDRQQPLSASTTTPRATSPPLPSAKPSRPSTPATPTRPPRATLAWQAKVGVYYPDLTVADGVVAAVMEDDVATVDPRTRKVGWKSPVEFGSVFGDLVYLVDSRLRLRAVQASSGTTVWSYTPPFGQLPGPHFAGTGSLLCYGDTQIRAVGARTGRRRWTSNVSAEHGLVAGDGVVVALAKPTLVGLSAETGAKRWTYRVSEGHSPLVAYGLVFVTDVNGMLHAIHAGNGKRAWLRPGMSSGMQAGGGLLYISDWGGEVRCLRPETGEQAWSRKLGNGEGAEYGKLSSIGLTGDVLYVGCTDRNVYALDAANGETRWTYPADMTLTSGPVAAGGLVFVGTRDGSVLALMPPAQSRSPSGGTRAGT